MMKLSRLSQRLIAFVISITLMTPQFASAKGPAPTPPLPKMATAASILKVESPAPTAAATRAKYGSVQELTVKTDSLAKTALKAGGENIAGNVIQSGIIMMAMTVAQVVKMRLDKARLMDGQTLTYDKVKEATETAAQDIFCGAGKGTATQDPIGTVAGVATELSCSGEIWFSTIGGMGVQAVFSTAAFYGMKLFTKGPAFGFVLKLVVGVVSSFLMLAGFQMSGYLWTQALQVINDPAKEAQARGLMDRWAGAWLSGKGWSFSMTSDGQLFNEIMGTVWKIVMVDGDLRAKWMDNTFRFGLARGEFIVNLALLMSALAIGNAVGGAIVVALEITAGWAIALITFIVASVFAAVVGALVVFMPDLKIGEALTAILQNYRSWSSWSYHDSLYASLDWNKLGFKPIPEGSPYWYASEYEVYRNDFIHELKSMSPSRADWMKVAIEKYYELTLKVSESEYLIEVATNVIKNSQFRDGVMMQDGQTLVTFEEAKKKFCGVRQASGPKGGLVALNCDFKMSYQLQKIDESRKTIEDAKKTLVEIAREMLTNYESDVMRIQQVMDDESIIYPPEIAQEMLIQRDTAHYIFSDLAWMLAAKHEEIRLEKGLEFADDQQRLELKAGADAFFTRGYINGIDEASTAKRVQEAIANQ